VPSRDVELVNVLGMHMRPARQFSETASRYPCRITVSAGGQQVNGKSIMEMMLLAATRGTVLTLDAEGEQAEACLEALTALVREKFHED